MNSCVGIQSPLLPVELLRTANSKHSEHLLDSSSSHAYRLRGEYLASFFSGLLFLMKQVKFAGLRLSSPSGLKVAFAFLSWALSRSFRKCGCLFARGPLGCLSAQTSRAQRKRRQRSFAVGHPKAGCGSERGKQARGGLGCWAHKSCAKKRKWEEARWLRWRLSQVSTYRRVRTAKKHVPGAPQGNCHSSQYQGPTNRISARCLHSWTLSERPQTFGVRSRFSWV